jgi:DNA-binding transcriptional ArsR family regulator
MSGKSRTGESRGTFVDWQVIEATLADPRRRQILALLRRRGATPVAEVVSAVAGPIEDGSGGGPRDRGRLRTTLAHAHLPELERAGLVEWDRARGVVGLTERGRRLPDEETLLEWPVG